MNPIKAVLNYARFLQLYLPIHFKTILQYKTSFVIHALTMAANDFFMVFFWWIFFANLKPINGWGMGEILLILAFATLSYGFFEIFFGGARRNIQQKVINGTFDFYLTKPKSPLQHILVSEMEFAAFGEILFAWIVYYYSGYFTIPGFFLLHVLSLFAGIVFAFSWVLFDLPVFWIGRNEKLAKELKDATIHFSTYPAGIFGGTIKIFLFTVFPTAFISTVPAMLIISFNPVLLAILIAFSAFFAAIVSRLFYSGLKKYESGNLIDQRT